jgi:hypothetical protein
MTLPDGKLRLCDSRRESANLVEMSSFRFTSIGKNLLALLAEVFPESRNFAVAVDGINGLFESYCYETSCGAWTSSIGGDISSVPASEATSAFALSAGAWDMSVRALPCVGTLFTTPGVYRIRPAAAFSV